MKSAASVVPEKGLAAGDIKEFVTTSTTRETEDEVEDDTPHAARAWSIMRRGIHEQMVEHRKAHTAVGWNLLQVKHRLC